MDKHRPTTAAIPAPSDETACRAVFDALGDAVLVYDAETGEIRESNRKVGDLFGYSPDEARRLNISDLVRDGQPSPELASGAPGQPAGLLEWRVQDRSGRESRVEARLSRTVIQGREQVCAVLRDLSRRTPSAAPPMEDESFYRLVTEGSLAGVYLVQDGLFRYVNPVLAEIFGYHPGEIIGRLGPLDLTNPADYELIAAKTRRRLSGEREAMRFSFRGLRRDGATIYCEVLSRHTDYQGRPAVMGTLLDISERVVAGEALLASEANYHTIFNGVNDAIAVVSLETGNFLEVNQKWCEMTGYTAEEARGLNVAALCLDEPPYKAADAMRWITEASKERPQLFEFQAQTKEGRRHWVEINLRRAVIGGQERLMTVIRDISPRKQAEEALRISEGNYRTIYNSASDAIVVAEIETGKFLDVNQKWFDLTGYQPEEVQDLSFEAFCQEKPPFTKEDAWGWFKKAVEEGPQIFEWRFKDKRAQNRWVEMNLKRTVIGGKECVLASIRDISGRKQDEVALTASEAKYRDLVEQIPAITYISALDNVSSPFYISPQIEAILGFTPEELIADPQMFENRIHPEDRDRVLTDLLLSYAKGGPFAAEYRMLSKSGRVVWFRDESKAVYDSEGRPLFMQGVALDITNRKKAEEALQEVNNKLRALVQASPLAMMGLDLHGKVVSWNTAAERIFGWRQDEVLGQPLKIVPEGRDYECKILWQRVLQGEQFLGVELQRRKKDGSPIDVSLSTALLYDAAGHLAGAMGVFEDITARKRTAAALRESEARFRAIFEGAPIGIALADLQRTLRQWNPAMQELLGYSDAEMRRQVRPEDLTHPDDWGADQAMFKEMVAGKRNGYQLEKRIRHKQGHWVWVRFSVSLVRDAADHPQFAVGMVEDITERKRAQEATEEIRRQQEAVLTNIADMAWLKDREGRFIVVNETLAQACAVAPEDLVGRTDLYTWPRELVLKYQEDDREVIRTGQRKKVEELLVDGQGNLVWVETIKTPIFDERGEVIGTAGVARDVTERRRMEEALRKVSRALMAVTECHQALMRAGNVDNLLSEVCRIIVEVGGYRMAWVGFGQVDEAKSVRPMAYYGFEKGYMQTLKVSWADVERGRGPVGTAIRTGKPVITRDTKTDPGFAPWRQEAERRGYASVLALPLPLGNSQPLGALAIYAQEVNAFDDEEINLLIGLVEDLSYGIKVLRAGAERRRAEESLRASEKKYRSLMDSSNDGIVLADSQGKITEVNRRAEDLLGFSKAELLSMPYLQIHPPQKRGHVLGNFKKILTTGSGPLHECEVIRKDGRVVPVDITHIMVHYGRQKVIQAVFRDITERRWAEEALRDSEQKLRLLASQCLIVQERERQRVSRELHDELGQSLTVLKIHLVGIENKLHPDQQELKVNCENLLNFIDTVIENVRRLSWDLSPSSLEDLGLSSSLKYLVQETCRNNHMIYSLAMDEIDNLFSPETKINIYRIFQESLTNIVRHANASRIDVDIKKSPDRVTFLIKDDGKGFDLTKARPRSLAKRGLGLTTMNERALMAGGTLNIWSKKGKGVLLTLTIPI